MLPRALIVDDDDPIRIMLATIGHSDLHRYIMGGACRKPRTSNAISRPAQLSAMQ